MANTFGKLDDVPVSGTDEVFTEHGAGKTWKLGEFDATNSPLSAAEIEHRERLGHGKWAPRTLENIEDMVPIPEHELQLT